MKYVLDSCVAFKWVVTEADTAKSRVNELEDELCAARESLRRVIKAQNRAP